VSIIVIHVTSSRQVDMCWALDLEDVDDLGVDVDVDVDVVGEKD
jgi:hypothetical protein